MLSLAWFELYLIFGNLFRKLNLTPEETTTYALYIMMNYFDTQFFDSRIEDISFREYFVPIHRGKHLQAYVEFRAL